MHCIYVDNNNIYIYLGDFMITINLVCVGNLKETFWKEAEKEYLKRISRFCKFNLIEIQEKNKESTDQITLQKEGKEILSKCKGYIILMDREGQAYSSENFSKRIEKISLSNSELTFVIGSSCGVSDEVKQMANEKISFGPNTFPHNLARIMLLEQIYRAFTISNGIKYHK